MDAILNFIPDKLNLDKNVSRTERIISAIAGSLLMIHGIKSGRKISEIPLGSFLLFRGATGFCPVKQTLAGTALSSVFDGKFSGYLNGSSGSNGNAAHPQDIDINTCVLVNRPRQEVYAFWRKLENLPLFMKHLSSVTEIDKKHSLWSAKIPGGLGTLDWESEIMTDQPNERLTWRSLVGSEIRNAGNVTFKDAGMDQTEIEVSISYQAPGGVFGEKVGQLLSPVFEKMVKSDIENFKKYLETSKV